MDGGPNQLKMIPGCLPHILGSSLSHFLILVLVAALLFFGRLGCPLQEPEEPRYAEIPRQMLEKGSLLVPVLHGLPYYDKPPLLYWLVMASYSVLGIHDWAARLVSCGAGFLSVLLTYFWGRQTVGPRAAFAGAMILCLSARFVYLGRLLTMNGLLCLWVVAALALAHMALSGSSFRWGWWLLSAVASALGLLTKGPVALVLVLVPALAFQALDRRGPRPRLGPWLVYLALAVGLASPWYLIMAATEPDFLGYFFWKHNLMRYVAPFDHAKPCWFYLPDLLLGMLPWSLLLIPLIKSLGWRRVAARLKRAPPSARPTALGFFLLASLWCLVFYSAAGSKRAAYILPAMPPLALALGCYLVQGPGRRPAASWRWCGAATFVVLLAALHFALPGYARKFAMRGQVRQFTQLVHDSPIPVVCYPRGWDSVSFYLERDDVHCYSATERRQLIAELRASPRTLAFIKSDHSLEEFLQDLHGSLQFVPEGGRGYVTVGWVQRRVETPLAAGPSGSYIQPRIPRRCCCGSFP